MTLAFALVAMLHAPTENLPDNAPDATNIDAIVVTGSASPRDSRARSYLIHPSSPSAPGKAGWAWSGKRSTSMLR